MFDSHLATQGPGGTSPVGGGRPAAVAEGPSVTRDVARRTLGALYELVEQVGALAEPMRGSTHWSGAERADALRVLDRLAGVLATVRSGVLMAEQLAQTSLRPGDRDFAAARARQTRTGLGDARRDVRQAETLVTVPAMASAVAQGRVPLPHVDALARVAESGGAAAGAALTRPDVQERLVGLAQRQGVKEFTASAARLLAAVEPESLERSVAAQRRARFFVMSHQAEGTFLRGRLDRLSAEVLRVAIASVGMAPDVDRDKQQADADALVALAERATSGMAGVRARPTSAPAAGGGPTAADPDQELADGRVSGVAHRPVVSLLLPVETYAELREAQRRRAEDPQDEQAAGRQHHVDDAARGDHGRDAEHDRDSAEPAQHDQHAVEPATLEDGTPLARSQVARLLCDCTISRIVVAADGLPLDVGRSHRVYTAAQRRAVIVRDRACAWNGCDVPAAYCEIHHIRWWNRDGGPTDLANGVLLCSHHHHVVHQHDLTLSRLGRDPRPGTRQRLAERAEPVRYAVMRRDGTLLNAPPGYVRPAVA